MERPPAPWPLLVLDSGGLSACAENHEKARAALSMCESAGTPVFLPSVIIAESTRATARDAMVNRIIAGVTVVAIDHDIAREAAALKNKAQMSGVEHTIDAIVVAVAALAGGGAILTSDPIDITALADRRPDLRIRTFIV